MGDSTSRYASLMSFLRVACLALMGAACGCAHRAADAPPASAPTFSLSIAASPVGVIYDYEKLLLAVDAGGAEAAMSFDASDIERFVIGEAPSELMCLIVKPRARERLSHVRETTPFVVRVGRTRLFAGVVYPKIGAAAIDAPVMHVEPAGALLIGAHQGSAYGIAASHGARNRIDRPELRAALASVTSKPNDPKTPCQ